MMRAGPRLHAWRILAALACLLLGACAATSRVADTVTTQSLAASQKAVVVMRLGAAGPACKHVAVLLGVRQAEGYRALRALFVASIRAINEPPVAEAELDPGEYHLLAYKCIYKNNAVVTVADNSDTIGVYRSSFARFTLRPGEILNVGYLHFNAHRVGLSAFGRPLRKEIYVSDWPIADLEQFKAKRPQIYAQMTTRLMQLDEDEDEPSDAACRRLEKFKAEGKVQALPTACTAPPARPAGLPRKKAQAP